MKRKIRREDRSEGSLSEAAYKRMENRPGPKESDKFGNPVGTKYDAYDNPIFDDGAETI